MLLAVLSGALVVSALPVQVESASCPTGPEVEQALLPMLPQVPEASRRDVARVTRVGRALHIELVNPDAALIAERSLDVDGTCAELAGMAAVVIAAWESDVHAEFARSHAEPSPAVQAEASAAPTSTSTSTSTSTAKPPAAASYDVAMGPTLSLADSLAVGGGISGRWTARGAGLGVHASAAGETTRTVDLDGGQAHWRRWMGSVEADWRWVRGRAAWDLHAGLAMGWLTAVGSGFASNQSRTSLSPGAQIGLRAAWGVSRHFAVWVDLLGLYWTRRQAVSSASISEQHDLPRFQLLTGLGLAVRNSAPGP